MSTQGLLSVVQGGKVKAKIVAGCNGMNVPKLARALRRTPTADPQVLLKLCKMHGVCCDRCVVIQTSPIEFFVPEDQDFDPGPELERWKRTFSDPKFNPRWDHGTAAYSEIVDIDLCQEKSRPKTK